MSSTGRHAATANPLRATAKLAPCLSQNCLPPPRHPPPPPIATSTSGFPSHRPRILVPHSFLPGPCCSSPGAKAGAAEDGYKKQCDAGEFNQTTSNPRKRSALIIQTNLAKQHTHQAGIHGFTNMHAVMQHSATRYLHPHTTTQVQWSEDMIKADPILGRSRVRFRVPPWVSSTIARDHLA